MCTNLLMGLSVNLERQAKVARETRKLTPWELNFGVESKGVPTLVILMGSGGETMQTNGAHPTQHKKCDE